MEEIVNIIVQTISTIGFPIVCSGALFQYILQNNKRYDEQLDKLTEALNNNTTALTKLCAMLGVDTNDNEVEQ